MGVRSDTLGTADVEAWPDRCKEGPDMCRLGVGHNMRHLGAEPDT